MKNVGRSLATRHAGFTVAELLVGIALVAIVAAVGTPIAAMWRNHYAFTSAVRQMAFEIGRLRMQAIGQNVFGRLRLDGTNRYVRERSTDGASFVADGPAVNLPPGVSAFAFGDPPKFNRQGLADTDSWIVLIGYDAEAYAVLHSNVLGRVDTAMSMW